MIDKILIAQQINRFLQMSVCAANLTDTNAMELADLYPHWRENVIYNANDIVKYGVNADGETQLWRVIQAHTSQSDWTPDNAPSLFSKIGFDESGTPIWTQPLGTHDAYQSGDIVMYNGQKWKSTVDNNVWQPGVYGWELSQN